MVCYYQSVSKCFNAISKKVLAGLLIKSLFFFTFLIILRTLNYKNMLKFNSATPLEIPNGTFLRKYSGLWVWMNFVNKHGKSQKNTHQLDFNPKTVNRNFQQSLVCICITRILFPFATLIFISNVYFVHACNFTFNI